MRNSPLTEIDPVSEADKILMAAVEEAIDTAVRTAGPELRAVGSRASPHDYFADGVLRHLFLRLCRADPTSNTGGDPETAWKILYAGRIAARHWERESGRPSVGGTKKDRPEDVERDESERRQLALSAEKFALTTVIRALVDHARASDPTIDERLEAVIDARHARLGSATDTDREFTQKAKASLSLLARRPD
ncbi:hypothetical protein DFI02_112119 [Rhizobium sp. PP-F2F-G20b]|nr:hypothetical protein C8J32_1179 [Rhizobium sp. PP-CC-3A-592]PYE41356.1 hypothetical protein DFI02_112119 [Rhizobium sp. PP-F2F-G20b]